MRAYISYASFVKDDMVYLIFNDNDKNLDKKIRMKLNSIIGRTQ